MQSSPAPPSRNAGFTLLELVIAIGLMALLIGMVFSTARTSLALGTKVVETQNEEMLQQAFIQLLSNRFAALPGNTRFDLKVEQSGRLYLTDLTLQNVPVTFSWGGEARVAKAIQLSTVLRRSGFLDIVLRYYENEILEDSESVDGTMSALDNQPMAEIVLLTDVAYFDWAVIDGRAMDKWLYEWDFPGRLPLQVELKMAIGQEGEEIRHVFWIPPKQNPEVMMRQMMQQAMGGQQPGEPGGGEGGGRPDGGGRPGGRPGAGQGGGRPGGAPGAPTIEIPSPSR